MIYLNILSISGARVMNIGFLMTEIIALFSIVGLALLPLTFQQVRAIRTRKDI